MFAAQLIGAGTGDVEDLAAQRQHRLGLAVARLLGGAARGIALDQEDLGAIRRPARAIGELARQSGLTGRALTGDFAVLPASQTLFGALDDAIEQQVGGSRIGREPMVEMIAQRALDHASGFGRGQTLLGLPLELRLVQKDGEERTGPADDIVCGQLGGALVGHERAVGPEAAHQRGAHACLVATAQAGGDRVAVGGDKALLVLRPSECPLDPAGVAVERALAGEGSRCQRVALAEDGGQIVDQAARIVQDRFLRRRTGACEQRRIAGPADLDATVEVGPRPRHLVEGPRLEAQRFAKDLGIGAETHERAAPVGHGPGVLERGLSGDHARSSAATAACRAPPRLSTPRRAR